MLTSLEVACQRSAVVEEALSWEGTPYHTAGEIKGAGVDCLTFVICVFRNVGLCDVGKVPSYPIDWHLHRDEERYLLGVLQYCIERPQDYVPQPGDIVLWKYGRCFAHGALVVSWPMIIHAYIGHKCGRESAESPWLNRVGENSALKGKLRPRKVMTFKPWVLEGKARVC